MNGIGIQLPPWVMLLFFGYVAKHSYITNRGRRPRQSALVTFLQNMDLGKDFPKQVLK